MLNDNSQEIIAAILAAGMLPVLPRPRNPGRLTDAENQRLLQGVGHAVSMYSAVLEGLRASGARRID
jgi:hypothetical protein